MRTTLCFVDIVLIFLITVSYYNIYNPKQCNLVTESFTLSLSSALDDLDVSVDGAVSEGERVLPALRTGVVVVRHRAPLGDQGAGRTGQVGKWV